MGFKRKSGLWLAVVLLCSMVRAAQTDDAVQITVRVRNSAGVGETVLSRAEAEASRVFALAGITIEWVNCARLTETMKCHGVLGPNEFDLHVVPTGKTSSDLVFGESFLGADGTGKYVDVFFNRIAGIVEEPQVDVADILGAVSAHELGHLLLGSRSHSGVGIMQPIWEHQCLREIGMGKLTFTKEQRRLMRSRIQGETAHLILTRVRVRNSFEEWY